MTVLSIFGLFVLVVMAALVFGPVLGDLQFRWLLWTTTLRARWRNRGQPPVHHVADYPHRPPTRWSDLAAVHPTVKAIIPRVQNMGQFQELAEEAIKAGELPRREANAVADLLEEAGFWATADSIRRSCGEP